MEENKILVVTSRVVVKAGMEEEFMRKTHELQEACRGQEGLLMYSIMRDIRNPNVFCWLEYWESEKHLRDHANSPEIIAWKKEKGKYVLESSLECWHFVKRVTGKSFGAINWSEK